MNIITSFHENMQGVVRYDSETSMPFTIQSSVKQRCVCIFFPYYWALHFDNLKNYVLICKNNGKQFNLAYLRVRTKVCSLHQRNAVSWWCSSNYTKYEYNVQQLIGQFNHAYKLTINTKKKQMSLVKMFLSISINDMVLKS